MATRINFSQLFRTNIDGSVEPLVPIRVAGIQLGPGVRFSKGVLFSGIDFTLFIGKDFSVEIGSDGVYEIVGVFK
jgi:hypothetical protein